MASLTDNIGTVNSGKPIINPGPADPSILGAIADFGSQVVPGLARLGEAREAARAESALDETAGRLHEIMLGANNATNPETAATEYVSSGPAPFDSELAGSGIPSDVVSATRDLERARAGVAQGRLSPGALNLQIERMTTELFTQFPDQRNEIATYISARGFDHYLYRAAKADTAMYQAEQETQINSIQTQFDYAARLGLVTNANGLEEGAAIGRRAMAAQAQRDAANAAAQAALENRKLTLEERRAALGTAETDLQSSIIAQVSTNIVPLVDQIGLAISAAGTDTERQTQLSAFQTRTRAALVTQQTRAIAEVSAAGGDPKGVTDFFTQQITALDSLFTSSFEQNGRALKNIEAGFGISAAQALPTYHSMVQALGQGAVNAMLADPSGTIKLPEAVMNSIKSEMVNFNPADPRGAVTMARMIGYLRREQGLQDLSGEEAAQFVQTNATAVRANQTSLLAGDSGAARPYLNSLVNLTEAIVELPPTATSIGSLRVATGLHATPEGRRAMTEAIKADPEYGLAALTASRNAAAKTLSVAQNMSGDEGGYRTRYDPAQGKYVTTPPTRADYNAFVRRSQRTVMRPGPSGPEQVQVSTVPPYEQFIRNVPAAIRERETVLNANLAHLVETRQYDPAFANMTPRQTRALLIEGQMPSTGAPGADSPDADAAFETMIQGLDTQLQGLITNTTSRPVPTPRATGPIGERARSAVTVIEGGGFPRVAAAGIVGHLMTESRLDTGARNPGDGRDGSDSIGIAQWNAERARGLQQFAAGRDVNDINVQLEYLMNELNTTEKDVGDRLKSAGSVDEAAAIMMDFLRPAGWRRGRPEGVPSWEERRRNARSLVSG